MTNSSNSSSKQKNDSNSPKPPPTHTYTDLVRMTGERLITAVLRNNQQGGRSEH